MAKESANRTVTCDVCKKSIPVKSSMSNATLTAHKKKEHKK